MSDPTDNGIDFYGDVDKELSHNDINDIDSRDLYDEVLSSRVDESHEREKNGGPQHHGMHAIPSMVNSTPIRQYQLYIGNLTWWTTDADITDSIENMGVSDFIEVKFYENVANGQSKGFCKISVASETSMKTIMDKMPKKDLHGRDLDSLFMVLITPHKFLHHLYLRRCIQEHLMLSSTGIHQIPLYHHLLCSCHHNTPYLLGVPMDLYPMSIRRYSHLVIQGLFLHITQQVSLN